MQNSLDRLLTGMAAALHERVLPALDDEAAAAQVRAAIELLGNLSTRVTWDLAHLAEVRDRVTPVLARLQEVGAPVPGLADVPTAPVPDAEELRADVVARMDALARAQMWLARQADVPAGLREQVDAFVDWHLAEEAGRLRSASFGRPTEINQSFGRSVRVR